MQAWQQRIESYRGKPCVYFVTDISEFPPHWHKELEIVYVLGEGLELGQGGELFRLGPRDIFLSTPGEIHYFPSQTTRCRRIILQFDPSALDESGHFRDMRIQSPWIPAGGPTGCPAGSLGGTHELLERDIVEIGLELAERHEGFELAVKARLHDLLVHILRLVPLEKIAPDRRSRQNESLRRLDLVFRHVEARFKEEIYLEEIAAIANYSVYHFARFFKQATGMTFFEYLNRFRISKAAGLLESTSATVTEIAFQTGFSSIKTFNRLFKQDQGCSPLRYRKSKIREEVGKD
jgi:AraC-like DNA-binding protein